MQYKITPIDPIISRDARPFGAGGRIRSLDWLTQTAAAGAVRTFLYKQGCEQIDELLSVKIRGPFLLFNNQLGFARPLDIAVSLKDKKHYIWQIRPCKIPEGCYVEMPLEGLLPAEPDRSESDDDFKPEKINLFWSDKLMAHWLKHGKKDFELFDKDDKEQGSFAGPEHDERVHVRIDPETGASEDGQLFSTTGLDFVRKTNKLEQSCALIDIELGVLKDKCNLPERFIMPLGGERRLAEFSLLNNLNNLNNNKLESMNLNLKFYKGDKVRLVLASPGIFNQGWLPDWIDKSNLTGKLPGSDIEFKLISAVTGRWQPISGWSYEKGRAGAKAAQRMVPAGSVYFLELLSDEFNSDLFQLRSICSEQQAYNDGFGLALWGSLN